MLMEAGAAVFTTDTTLNPTNSSYDGQSIVISNCTVAIDGGHAFTSLRVATGGVLTHSASPNGIISVTGSVSDEAQVLSGTNAVALATSNVVTASVVVRDVSHTITYSNGVDYVLGTTNNNFATLARLDASTIPDGATVLVTYDYTILTTSAGLNLTLTGDLEVEPGAIIKAAGRGYDNSGTGKGLSAGSPLSGGGGGYGGYGGLSSSNAPGGSAYGSPFAPGSLGSSGGQSYDGVGGPGGGAVRINLGGTALVNGTITANGADGTNSRAGGGAGGSIWLTTQTFAGNGALSANGGAGEPIHGGGGGGGRIAVEFASNSFAGTIAAHGGNGPQSGGAGSIFLRPNGTLGQVTFDNGGNRGAVTLLQLSNTADLTVQGGAVAAALGAQAVSNLLVRSNSSLTIAPSGSGTLTLTVMGNATVENGATISMDAYVIPNSGAGVGYVGPGQGGSGNTAGGSGHGGNGGYGLFSGVGGMTYGSIISPTTSGSGGRTVTSGPNTFPGGFGGGPIRMIISGNLQLDGRISADATAGTGSGGSGAWAGGGSGGSVWLTLGSFSGAGTVSANGGAGGLPYGGGGGGGRIAVTYNSSSFSGTLSAHGGAGFMAGGAGSIYTKSNNSSVANFMADNAGLAGSNTVLDISSPSLNLSSSGGANVRCLLIPTLNSVNIGSNSAVSFNSPSVSLSISSSLNIASGGVLGADAVSSGGTGSGQSSPSLGSGGGGHAGYGGRGAVVGGGNAYGSSQNPNTTGSQGGAGSTSVSAFGGGNLQIVVNGPAVIDGRISANGGAGITNNGGGGSGGTVALTCNNSFAGSGVISADGGAGFLPNGGGGGGGRVAVFYGTQQFNGTLSAKGGVGFGAGGAGTVFIRQIGQNVGNLIIDNGGLAGTNTFVDSISPANVTIGPGALIRSLSSSLLNSLTVASNGFIQFGGVITLTVISNVTVLAGGKISGDGQGTSGVGNGLSSPTGSGGGAHGGYGGNGAGGDQTGRGGSAFDFAANPSGGGGNGGFNGGLPPGTGGGALHLTVNGLLNVLGSISANGFSVNSNNAGGGAGGSLWLSLGGLAGNGSISADGGTGHLPAGGGGGGGRIAISYSSNSYTGLVSVKGGNGFAAGGAGTIYWKRNSDSFASIILDNANLAGSNTLVNPSGIFDLTIQNRAWSSSVGSPRDLFIRTNSFLRQSGSVTVTRNMTVDAGGAVLLDSLTSSGLGAGYMSAFPRGGGGYGGYGALNPVFYGAAYGSALSPTDSGSPGGNGGGSQGVPPLGGNGGGAIHLTVSSTLTLNGKISANGGNGDYVSGGGSGGSIWLTLNTFTGSGQISANGGNGDGQAGGGSGGRVAITYTNNPALQFTGSISAGGGSGGTAGGAGTIYLKDGTNLGTLLLNNNGLVGTNTPVTQAFGLAPNLQVTGGAVAEIQGLIPGFSNITVTGGSALSCRAFDSLYLGVQGNLSIDSSSAIVADSKGSLAGIGPGFGLSLSGQGAGGGFGGAGGASASGAAGGVTNGSAGQPFTFGSGGGNGSGSQYNLSSQGGGIVRLSVGGTLDLEGRISANGNAGIQDDSGGGSGGSIWLSMGQFTGGGSVSADGGDGDLYNGGGGGGGRIAVYSPANTFTGLVSVAGGDGSFVGQTGTVFSSSILAPFSAISSSPTNTVSNTVSFVDISFSDAVNPGSVSAAAFNLFTPAGLLAQSNVTVSVSALTTVRFSFPNLNYVGNYRIEAGPNITDLFGSPMSQVYTGYFAISLSTISGVVTDTNSQPVAGVVLQPTGALQPATTDGTGNYSLGVPSGWTGTVIPSITGSMFIPSSRSYANVTNNLTGENYTLVPTIAATIQSQRSGTNLVFNWFGYSGVTYQIYYSTDLFTWIPFNGPLAGTNGPLQSIIPIDTNPQKFFRIVSQD
jgi:hypothetical protein